MVAMNLLKAGLLENQDKPRQNVNKKESVWLWGFRLSLKGMKLCINKP
jgi:hypothetical protein